MPQLTQIKETQKGRMALFFDGEFAFSLDADTFAKADLHEEDLLEEWQIEDLRTQSDTRREMAKAMDYLRCGTTRRGNCTRNSAASSTSTAPPTLWRAPGNWAF